MKGGGALALVVLAIMVTCTLCGRGLFEVTVPDGPAVTEQEGAR